MSQDRIRIRQLNLAERVALCLGSLILICLFVASMLVTPDPRGSGTHEQFGLPPCSFRFVFGIPCPSCGGTTSFAHFVRGEWPQAMSANSAGFSIALLSSCFVPWALSTAATGRTALQTIPTQPILIILVLVCLLATLQWAARLLSV